MNAALEPMRQLRREVKARHERLPTQLLFVARVEVAQLDHAAGELVAAQGKREP